MREQLIQYIELLFAGAYDAEDIKQEILQNTLDRYDDLIEQGKSPEAAYRLAISGIGDINEILGNEAAALPSPAAGSRDAGNSKLQRAVAVALYIVCPIPLIALGDEIGLSMLLILVAAATALMILAGKDSKSAERSEPYSPRSEYRRSICAVVRTFGLAAYFIVSFLTHAWYITWLIFPIIGCINGLINANLDLKENE